MSATAVTRALHDRFESIRRSEIERLGRKKLRSLTDDERQLIERVTADVVHAIASMPERALGHAASQPAVDALIQLFGL